MSRKLTTVKSKCRAVLSVGQGPEGGVEVFGGGLRCFARWKEAVGCLEVERRRGRASRSVF